MPKVDRDKLLATLNSLRANETVAKGSVPVLLMLKLLDPELYAQVLDRIKYAPPSLWAASPGSDFFPPSALGSMVRGDSTP